jgi:carboxylate-amine ligase
MDIELKPRRTRLRPRATTSFRFGIEEEYFLCDAATLQPAMSTPDALFACREPGSAARLNREMLQAQVEVATRPHTRSGDARDELMWLRRLAAESAFEHGLAILASGTHPTADWRQAVHSPKVRYDLLMHDLQTVGRRNMLCGMHVHVEVPDPDARIDIMVRLIPYVPLLLALSTSSPFWGSQPTGLKGYRLAAYDELPRTGMPELFRSKRDYDAYVSGLVSSGAIPNATHVWWTLRPSDKYPTLEFRAADACTRLDDAVAIAALYRCLVRRLCRRPFVNAQLDPVDRAISVENKWRAQRYGVEASFVSRAGPVSMSETLEDVLEEIASDAEALGCGDDVLHCRRIVDGGSSADAQLRVFAPANPADGPGGLDAVLRWLAQATVSEAADGRRNNAAARQLAHHEQRQQAER